MSKTTETATETAVREITVITTSGEKKVIATNATKYSELKVELTKAGYSLTNMKVVEGTNKTTLQHPDAMLPGGNFKVFLLPVKSKSGATSSKSATKKAAPKKAAKKAAVKEVPAKKATTKKVAEKFVDINLVVTKKAIVKEATIKKSKAVVKSKEEPTTKTPVVETLIESSTDLANQAKSLAQGFPDVKSY